jgi:hypothetical protein
VVFADGSEVQGTLDFCFAAANGGFVVTNDSLGTMFSI